MTTPYNHHDEKKLSTEHLEGGIHADDAENALDDKHVEGGKKKGVNTQLDDAAALLAAHGGHIEYTPEENKRVLRMVDLYVCVPMCLVYWLQQLDKSSVSYAAVFDLRESTGLVGTQYSWLSSGVYVAQLVFQPLSSYALIVFPVKYWVMFNFTAWSICTAATAAATNFTGLIICRILLGMFEATILPSFILVTQMWWTRREQSYRTIAWQVANSMAAILGPLLSYGVGHAKTGLKPYQSIFLCLGLVSLGLTSVVWWLMPNSPTTAKFLKNGNDRLIAIERLRENNTGTKSSKWQWYQVKETFIDPKTWLWAAMYVCCATPSGGFGAFGGIITKGLGFTSFKAILMQIPTGALQIVTLLLGIWITNRFKMRWPVLANRFKMRWPVLAFLCLPPIAGATGLLKVPRDQPNDLLGCYYVAMLLGALQPLLYTWANLNAAGSTKRVVTTAIMFVFQCVGNIIGPQVYLAKENPYYFTGLKVDIACWACLFVLILTQAAYLTYLNKKKEKQRAALGLPTDLKDISLMSSAEAAAYKIELKEILRAQGFDENKLNDSAFGDLTDWESVHFRYVI